VAGAPQINLAVAAIAAAFVNIALSTVAPSHPHRGVQDFEPRQIVDEHTIRSVGGDSSVQEGDYRSGPTGGQGDHQCDRK